MSNEDDYRDSDEHLRWRPSMGFIVVVAVIVLGLSCCGSWLAVIFMTGPLGPNN